MAGQGGHARDARYEEAYRQSVEDPAGFWAEQAKLIDWHVPAARVLDDTRPPFTRWFSGGQTNLCHNAVDRHLATRGDQNAVIFISTETNTEQTWTFAQLHVEVNRVAAMLHSLGVEKGDRVLIYMPMIPQALFAMLACVRIGAVHSVVFGGFAAASLASRVDDAKPRVVLTAEAGSRGGKVIEYKPLLDEAIELSKHKPSSVVIYDRGLAPNFARVAGRDVDWETLRGAHMDARVSCVWLESSEPSYILYTSGTTGVPKGVQRDTGGYAVALAASMKNIYCGNPGETFFATSDIGWVVGHSYIVYGPLINGMATVFYEGTPIRPDGGIWWKIVQDHKVTVMFSAPTAIRVLKKQDPAFLTKYDLSSLRALFLAGEPLDEPTARWIAEAINKPILDNYWQTETGWPVLAVQRGLDPGMEPRFGSPGKPVYGYKIKLIDENTGTAVGNNQKGVVVIEGPLPPGCMSTVWGDDARYVNTYWSLKTADAPGRPAYSSFDWGIRDDDGYYFILGRTDDVINVAGHRLGTREIEEAVAAHANIAECAVVGVADQLKGQVAMAFAIVKDASALATSAGRLKLEGEVMATVDHHLGAVGRPARVLFVNTLPKTRSGKMLRRVIQAVCENREAGDLTTIEDPTAVQQIRDALAAR